MIRPRERTAINAAETPRSNGVCWFVHACKNRFKTGMSQSLVVRRARPLAPGPSDRIQGCRCCSWIGSVPNRSKPFRTMAWQDSGCRCPGQGIRTPWRFTASSVICLITAAAESASFWVSVSRRPPVCCFHATRNPIISTSCVKNTVCFWVYTGAARCRPLKSTLCC